MFILRQVKALQSIKHVDACRIHGETNVAGWHGSRKTYRNDHAHNIAQICTDSSRLECIPTLQDQEHPWSQEGHSPNHESPSYKVHNHPQVSRYIYIYIFIHTACTMHAWKVKQTLSMFQEYSPTRYGKSKQILPYPRNVAQARYKKDKAYMLTSKRYGLTRYRKYKQTFPYPKNATQI